MIDLPPQQAAFPLPPSATRDPGPVRIGIIGLGRSGFELHGKPLASNPHFTLSAVSDTRPEQIAKARTLADCTGYERYESLIADPSVEVVVIATQSHLHAQMAAECLEAGKHVIMEKPFATSTEEAALVFDHAERCGKLVIPYHNRRFDPDVVCLREILNSGVLGPLVAVRLAIHFYRRRDDWQTLRHLGGGALRNWGAHMIDWCIHLFGADLRLEHVFLQQTVNPGDAEDAFSLVFTTGPGTPVHVEFLCCAGLAAPKWHVVGRYGSALADGESFRVRWCDPARLTALKARTEAAGNSYGMVEDLGFTETRMNWKDWAADINRSFHDHVYEVVRHGVAPFVTRQEVLCQMRLIDQACSCAIRRLGLNGASNGSSPGLGAGPESGGIFGAGNGR